MFAFFFFLLLFWAVCHCVRKIDDDGTVRSVAKQGLINVITRWLR